MHNYILLFFRALVATITIETVVLAMFFFLRRRGCSTRSLAIRVLVTGVVASCCTLPFVWFLFPAIIENRMFFLVVAELFAFVAEIPIIRGIVKTSWPEAAVISLLANSASFTGGLLMGIS